MGDDQCQLTADGDPSNEHQSSCQCQSYLQIALIADKF